MTIEKEINHTDPNGLRQGLWRTYHYNNIWYEVNYVNGVANGTWRDWWCNNGQLRNEGYYVNGIKEGEEIEYEY